jgi:Ni,Fe-hydrogenase maturation factor
VGVFFRREVVLGNQLWGDGGFGHEKIKMLRPNFLLSSSVQTKCNAVLAAL